MRRETTTVMGQRQIVITQDDVARLRELVRADRQRCRVATGTILPSWIESSIAPRSSAPRICRATS